MNNEPLLSVIVPIYNVEPYIRRCLNSIINQSYTNLEIICVDDGSSDRSGEIADEYASRDSRIIVVHKENGGLVSARKVGARLAKGMYIVNVDSDDWIEPNMYEEVLAVATECGADVITTQEIRDYNDYIIKTRSKVEEGLYYGERLRNIKERLVDLNNFFQSAVSVHVWDKVFLADMYREIQCKVPDEIDIGEDSAVVFPLLLEAKSIYILDKNYYHYCLRPDSIMGREYSINQDILSIYSTFITEQFEKCGLSIESRSRQANALILYVSLFTNLESIIDFDGKKLYPFGEVKTDEKIALYGSGKFGARLHTLFIKRGWFTNLSWYDTEGKNGADRVDDRIVKMDKIIVGAIQADAINSIQYELSKMGIDDRRVLSLTKIMMKYKEL